MSRSGQAGRICWGRRGEQQAYIHGTDVGRRMYLAVLLPPNHKNVWLKELAAPEPSAPSLSLAYGT